MIDVKDDDDRGVAKEWIHGIGSHRGVAEELLGGLGDPWPLGSVCGVFGGPLAY